MTICGKFALLCIFYFLFCNVTNAHVVINNPRPRLLINETDVERIRRSITTYSKDDFVYFCRYVSKFQDSSAEEISDSRYSSQIVRDIAFVGLIEKEKNFINSAINFAISLAGVNPSSGDDMVQRPRLLAMSYVYDWLYNYLTPQQKSIIRKGIIDHIEYLKYFLDNPLYTGGHSRYGNTVILAGLIALHGDYGDWHGNDLLETVKNHWEPGYNVFQSYVAQEGGYHMGWLYGHSYTDPLPYLLWEKATGQKWCEDWRSKQIYWYMYGLRGDESLPRSGDCWGSPPRTPAIR